MTVIKIEDFGGVAPRYSARLLQTNQAVLAQNAKLLSGELRGLHETQLIKDFNLSPPANGALTQSAGGSLSAATYYVRSTWILEGSAETAAGTETSLAVSANNVLNVAAPSSAPTGATGWNVYVSTASGTETRQNTSAIALGSAWVEPTSGLTNTGAKPPTAMTPVQRAYRLPSSVSAPIPISGSDNWISFFDSNVDFVRTPVLQDSFERYYWTGDSYYLTGQPQYNTRARINSGNSGSNAPFLLGVPTPVNAPIVTPPSGTVSTRSYVYTFVSAYGEEGPPSAPTSATGATGTWVISNFDTSAGSNRNITNINIYRTVTGANTTEYYFVAQITLGATSYNDTANDTSVASNNVLPSLTWTTPPAGLQGLTAHPGGFLIGFSGRDIWMSEPYHPHAWPIQYVQTMQTEVVGLAVYNNVVVVCTTSHPYWAEGMSPLALTFQKIDSIDPCVARRGIATTLEGVYYPSPQGIVKAVGGKTQLVTYPLFTREEWQLQFTASGIRAVPYGVQYIAFDSTATGFIFSPSESLAPLTTLDRFSAVTGVQIDQYSGDVYIISANQARLWDPPTSIPYSYTWQSKQFDLPNPVNMGAFRIKFAAQPVSISSSQLTDYTTFNTGRITKPLNCLNLAVINGVRTQTVSGYAGPQIRNPIAGSPLFPIGQYTTQNVSVQLTIWARNLNSVWEEIYSNSISDERIHRLPSGFKSDAWQVRFISNTPIYSFIMAETAKELKVA